MHQFFSGTFFNFEAIRILGTTRYGGCEAAEFVDAVGNIKNNDPTSWHSAWAEQARKAEALAEQARQSGDRVAARMAYLRASNYTRASGYMMVGTSPLSPDPGSLPIGEKVCELFRKATLLMDFPALPLTIPYEEEGITLPGYLYYPPPSCRLPGKVPILINTGGADSVQEELYYMHPAAGPELGYAVVTFEGPGQGITLQKTKLPMRPDWEVVTSAVLDYVSRYASEHPDLDLDLDRVAIAGASLGGYYALRGASDPRFKACVAIDPLYDLWDFATKHVSQTFLGAWLRGWISDGLVNGLIGLNTKFSFQMLWEISVSGRFFGLNQPAQILKAMRTYTLKQLGGSSYLDKVKCPVLVSGAAKSLYLDADDHTAMIYNKLKNQKESEKELWLARAAGEGGLQAKMGAMALCNQKVYKFLDKELRIERRPLLTSD